jgi:hypothetical protein
VTVGGGVATILWIIAAICVIGEIVTLDPRHGALRHRPDHRRSVDRTWRRQYLLLIGVTPFPAKEPGRRLSRCGAFRVNDWSSWSSN